MIKQIAMVAILGLVLVLATAPVYTQSSFAGGWVVIHGNVAVNPGGPMVPASGQNSQGNDNSQGHRSGSTHVVPTKTANVD